MLKDGVEVVSRTSGAVTEDLAAGSYVLVFASSVSFTFDVDGDGDVSSGNMDAAEGGSKSLTFKNTTITVVPGNYDGTYFLNEDRETARCFSGEQPIVLLPGISNYSLGFAPSTNFRFDVDGDGKVSSRNTDAAEGGAQRLDFHNVTISVDPTDYTGTYFFNEDRQIPHSGESEVVLLPGLTNIILGLRPGVGERFSIAADGVPDSPVPVSDGGETRTFLLAKKAVVVVEIDVRPGSTENPVKPGSNGRVPVAILTTQTFDASSVDPETVRFGRTGQEASPRKSGTEDVDGDGDIDMLLHFKISETGIQCGDTSALLVGATQPGQAIKGSDAIKTVGCR